MFVTLLALGLLAAPAQEKARGPAQIHLPDGKIVRVLDFAVQLQSLDVPKLKASATDLVVIDPYEGKKAVSGSDVASLRTGPRGRRIVLATVPVAEIDPRSPIWQRKWDADNDGKPDKGAPAWLEARNAEGAYPVKFWTPEWQQVLYAGKSTLVSSVIKRGFDGFVMDPGEALETKELQTVPARQQLGKLMLLMSAKARTSKQGFLCLAMNPDEMMEYGGVMLALDGVLVEGIYYGKDEESKPSPEGFLKDYEELEELAHEGRMVLCVAYTRDPAQIADNDRRARAKGFVPFASSKG